MQAEANRDMLVNVKSGGRIHFDFRRVKERSTLIGMISPMKTTRDFFLRERLSEA
jgi:hypothetical protein